MSRDTLGFTVFMAVVIGLVLSVLACLAFIA